MPVINGVYLKDFPELPSSVVDANIIPIALSGNQVAYRTTVGGIVTNARVIGKVLTGLSVTGGAIVATDTILEAFGKVQNQLNNRVSSVGLSMPSAFTVTNSPVTGSGTLTVTGAGLASQYIRGDGQLADFPTGGGGGSSVSYYLNGSVNQGTFSGNTYYEMNKTAILGAGTDFTISADGYIASFITDANDPDVLLIPAGNWNLEFYFSASSSGGTPSYYVELSKWDGSTFTAIASNWATPELIAFGTSTQPYFSTLAVPETVMTATDRLAIRVYVNHSGRTITLHTENNTLCQIITTFTTGLQSLNGLTKQAQFFAVGTSGTDFAISSSVATHTFNLPTASAVNRGALSSADWTTFNSKQNAITLTTIGTSGAATLIGSTLNIPNYADGGVLSLSAIGSSPNANGGTITGTVLNLEPASASFGGVVTTGTQTFAGAKTFNDGLSATKSTGNTISSTNSASGGLAYYGQSSSGPGAQFDSGSSAEAAVIAKNTSTGPLQYWNNSSGTVATMSNGGNFSINGIFTQTVGTSESKLTTTAGSGLEIRSDGSTSADRNIIFKLGTTVQGQIYNSGNWFIGSSPTDAGYKLDVNGTVRFSGALTGTSATFSSGIITTAPSSAIGLELRARASDDFSQINFTNNAGSNINSSFGVEKVGTNGGLMYFYTKPDGGSITERMRITSGGNVLIGTTTDIGRLLYVNDVMAARGYVIREASASRGGLYPYNLVFGSGTDYSVGIFSEGEIFMAAGGSATKRFTMTTGGNVGIGTTSPDYLLTARGRIASQSDTTFAPRVGVDFNSANTGGTRNRLTLLADSNAAYVYGEDNFPLVFTTNTTERMRIESDGDIRINFNPGLANGIYFNDVTSNAVTFYLIPAIYSGSAPYNANRILASNSTHLAFEAGGSERMRITSGGDVGIGTTSPTYQLQLSTDSAAKPSTNTWTISSDDRIKENINPYTKGLDVLMSINPVTYDYNGKAGFEKIKGNIGIIAQDVLDLLPESISTYKTKLNEDDLEETELYNFNSHALTYVLINAIKELKSEIDILKNK